jgi:hypothetical protein
MDSSELSYVLVTEPKQMGSYGSEVSLFHKTKHDLKHFEIFSSGDSLATTEKLQLQK